MKDPYNVPQTMQHNYEAITVLTGSFCSAKLTEEHADMCRQMAAKLARKRPSPIARGRTNNWAAGIVHAIATVNFAFDSSATPHIKIPDICDFFAVGKDAPANKSREIRKLLNIHLMDPQWTIPSRIDSNPMVWWVAVNGMIVDARDLPRFMQEEAFDKGLIPYIPDDRL